MLFGATHERGRTETVATAAGDAANLDTLAQRFPDLAERLLAVIEKQGGGGGHSIMENAP